MFSADLLVALAVAAGTSAVVTVCLLAALAPLFVSYLRCVIREEANRTGAELIEQLRQRENDARSEGRISAGLHDGLARAAGEPPRPRRGLHSIGPGGYLN